MQKAIVTAIKIPVDGHGILGTISLNDQITPLPAKPGCRRIHTGKVKRIGLLLFAGGFIDGIFPVPCGENVMVRNIILPNKFFINRMTHDVMLRVRT